MKKQASRGLPIIGWREWVGLPDHGVTAMKVKVDTGARSSALHVVGLRSFEQNGQEFVRFKIYPSQRSSSGAVLATAPVLEYRDIRSSSGKSTLRPTILTQVSILGLTWQVELTLANRDQMGFRMLLGREAIRGRFLVDSGNSYYGERPVKRSSVLPVRRKKKSDSPETRS